MIYNKSQVRRTVIIVISVCLINSTAQAQYNGGTGEPNAPYQIATAEDLILLSHSPLDWDKHFKLMADIDLSGSKFEPAVIPWFSGTFDGQGYVVHNLKIRSNVFEVHDNTVLVDVGFFGKLESGAVITRLGLDTISVYGGFNVGGLVGMNSGCIVSCYYNGSVGDGVNVGGLVGENSDFGIILYSYNTGTVIGGLEQGGIMGGLVGINSGNIIACYNTDEVGVTTGKDTVGGLVGENTGNIIASYSNGKVRGYVEIGGLVGDNSNGNISLSYSTGEVVGYVGWGAERLIGGLIGNNGTNVYNVYTGTYSDSRGSISYSFWDMESSGEPNMCGNKDGFRENTFGKTTAEMQTARTFIEASWDFVGETINGTCDYWEIHKDSYPTLAVFSEITPVEPNGAGTRETPYLISDANELGFISYRPLAHYCLVNNIDLSDINWRLAVIPWFGGNFDGKGYNIRSLHIKGGSYLGLFGILGCYAEVRNLGLEAISIEGAEERGDCIGGLVGANFGYIKSNYSTGTVSGHDEIGGLVGDNQGILIKDISGLIEFSCSNSLVSGQDDVGGLVGKNSGYVTSSYSHSDIICERGTAGGLVGSNYGSIESSYSASTISGYSDVGGLVGYDGSDPRGTTTSSFWDVETSSLPISAGGIYKPTVEMQMAITFLEAGWVIVDETANGTDNIWWILEGRDYPRLWWQPIFALYPSPPDGTISVDISVTLSWNPRLNDVLYDVYLSTDSDTITNADINDTTGIYRGRQADTLYTPEGIRSGTSYYWRIDGINNQGNITTGDIWTFTTTPTPPQPPPPPKRACFTSETNVWVNSALVPISKVGTGQSIYLMNSFGSIEEVQEHEGTFACYDVLLESGNCLSVAENHYFLAESGQWLSLHSVQAGTKLKTAKGSVEIIKILKRPKPYIGKVYNIKVAGSDQYMVGKDGVIVRDY